MFKRNWVKLLWIMSITMVMFGGCFKEEEQDQAIGVQIVRSGSEVTVKSTQDVYGEQIEIKGIVAEGSISVKQKGIIFIRKEVAGNTEIAIVKTGAVIRAGEELVTINSVKSLDVKLLENAQAKDIEKVLRLSRVDGANKLLGDFNSDKAVDLKDLAIMKNEYGTTGTALACDIAPAVKGTDKGWENIFSIVNKDNKVSIIDLVVLGWNFDRQIPKEAITATAIFITGDTNVDVGKAIHLIAKIKYTDGTLTTSSTLVWTTSNSAIATVADSTVDGVAEGTVGISASANGVTGTIIINVNKTVVQNVDGNAFNNAKQSYWTLTSSNGNSVTTYTLKNDSGVKVNKLDRFKNHIYSNYDENTPSINYLYDSYFGYRKNGTSTQNNWFNSIDPYYAGYVNGTGIMNVNFKAENIKFETYYFNPLSHGTKAECSDKILVKIVRAENLGADANDCSVFSILNFHMGGVGNNLNEALNVNKTNKYLIEKGTNAKVIYKNITDEFDYTADVSGGANNAWIRVRDGKTYASYPTDSLSGNDITVGIENKVNGGGKFASGEVKWYGVVVGLTDTLSETELYNIVNDFMAARTPEKILENEKNWWSNWHSAETYPTGITSTEKEILKQSAAVLKMGQLNESGKGYGQILASLVPGMWNISWVRDASYAIMGLSNLGHFTEAKKGLEFMLNAEMKKEGTENYYQKNYIESTDASKWGLGVKLSAPYAISVTRYFGNGVEESDSNARGPNIEWDNWGLFLWALGDYVEKSGDTQIVTDNWYKISEQTADLLIDLIDPSLNILYPDSSIWERHWAAFGSTTSEETKKHFAYSSICAYQGLKYAAKMAELMGKTDKKDLYTLNSEKIKSGVKANLVVKAADSPTGKPILAGNYEEMPNKVKYMDLAVIEAINTGLITDSPDVMDGTIDAFNKYLKMSNGSPGYFRNDDGTWYDKQEWVVIDLRVAAALSASNNKVKSKEMLDWISSNAGYNFNLIGELLSETNSAYQGAIPMCGFGPGAYILGISEYYK